ncbi:class I SAM-dependent methyltransferase [Candidatus Gottesmanbacteria bacterium]|nr:class I SAM-dependent methyltransferase [Candidatus Gottesmanbacteria bacterium]
MKSKYWAKNKYSTVDPLNYETARFQTNAGKLIDEAEKKAVLNLLLNSGIDFQKELKILDAATGPGRLAFYLQDNFRKAKITGMDINENMLERARDIARGKKSNINFIKGDIYHLPFQKAQFDAVVGLRFSMHLPDINKIFQEFSRIIKNDGILIFDIFNLNSVLRFRDSGYYTINELKQIARKSNFNFQEYKGIILLGETVIRRCPDKLLSFVYNMVESPKWLARISTKLVLAFKKL